MKLLIRIRRSNLSKGKEGLIAVKKQVTKNGKTFMQTFHVKPSSVPAEPTVITQEHLGQDIPKNPQDIKNMPDGFYVQHTFAAPQISKVPSQYIHSVFKHLGQTWVCHLSVDVVKETIGPNYVVTELTTGLRVDPGSEKPDEAIERLKTIAKSYTEEGMQKVIDSKDKISDLDLSGVDTDAYTYVEPPRVLSKDDLKKEVDDILKTYFKGGYEDEDSTYSNIAEADYTEIEDWLRDHYSPDTTTEVAHVRDLLKTSSQRVRRFAVNQNINLEDAETMVNNIDMIQGALAHNDYKDIVAYEDDILEWARKEDVDLTVVLDADDYDVTYSDGGTLGMYMTGESVIAYAYSKTISLDNAHDFAIEDAGERETEVMRDVSFEDSYGNTWEYDDLYNIGRWVCGSVAENRLIAKELDNERRIAAQVGDVDAFPEASGNPIVRTIEAMMSRIDDKELYRGTANPDWTTGSVGDVIPIGLASFSHSRFVAETTFGGGWNTLVILFNDENAPIVGVDVDNIIESGTAWNAEGTLSSTGVSDYVDEKEVIVRSPGLEILRKEKIGHQLIIHAKMAEMNLIPFVKSETLDRIKAMEATFDYPLHREEGAPWNQ